MLQKSGLSKVTYYFDDVKKMAGTWELYPSLQISKNITAVHVSEIPGQTSKYNFLVLVDMISNSVVDTLGPYYDSCPDALAVRLQNGKIMQLKVRLSNPPEPEDPKYTIVEYSRVGLKFIITKRYYID